MKNLNVLLSEINVNDCRDISNSTKNLIDFQINAQAGDKFKYRSGFIVKFRDENDDYYCAYITKNKREIL